MMTTTEINANNAARTRMALSSAGIGTLSQAPSVDFEVPFRDNTALSIAFNEDALAITVARVMPSGNITGQVVFTGMPVDVTIAAIVAMAKSLEA